MQRIVGDAISTVDFSRFVDVGVFGQQSAKLQRIVGDAFSAVDYSSSLNLGVFGQESAKLQRIVGDAFSAVDYSSSLNLEVFAQAGAELQRIWGDTFSSFDYSSIFNADQSFKAAVAGLRSTRFSTLQRGFDQQSGTAADSFGKLESVVTADPAAADHLKRLIDSTQQAGSFGLDYASLQGIASDLADRLDSEAAFEKQVRSALEPVQELTGFSDELLIDLGELLGWWERVKRHRVSTAGVVVGFTVGLTVFVLAYGSGAFIGPVATAEAVIIGGGLYRRIRGAGDESRNR